MLSEDKLEMKYWEPAHNPLTAKNQSSSVLYNIDAYYKAKFYMHLELIIIIM